MCDRIAGIEANRAPETGLRSIPVPFKYPAHVAGGELRLSEVWICADRLQRYGTRTRPHVQRARIAVHGTRGVGEGAPRPGKSVIWSKRNGTFVLLDGAHVRLRCTMVFKVPCPQVRIVRVGVLSLTKRKPAQAIGRKPEAHLLCDCSAQFPLQFKH